MISMAERLCKSIPEWVHYLQTATCNYTDLTDLRVTLPQLSHGDLQDLWFVNLSAKYIGKHRLEIESCRS